LIFYCFGKATIEALTTACKKQIVSEGYSRKRESASPDCVLRIAMRVRKIKKPQTLLKFGVFYLIL
jgi:hypothetical protein